MLAVVLIDTVYMPHGKSSPICDITGFMAEGKEKWQNHMVALQDPVFSMSFSHTFQRPKQRTWPCQLSTDLPGKGSEYVGMMMKAKKAVIAEVWVRMIEVDVLRCGYMLGRFWTGLLTIKRH